jgi:hypothetical protein
LQVPVEEDSEGASVGRCGGDGCPFRAHHFAAARAHS